MTNIKSCKYEKHSREICRLLEMGLLVELWWSLESEGKHLNLRKIILLLTEGRDIQE